MWPGPLRVSEVQCRNTCYKGGGGFFSEDALLSSFPKEFLPTTCLIPTHFIFTSFLPASLSPQLPPPAPLALKLLTLSPTQRGGLGVPEHRRRALPVCDQRTVRGSGRSPHEQRLQVAGKHFSIVILDLLKWVNGNGAQ